MRDSPVAAPGGPIGNVLDTTPMAAIEGFSAVVEGQGLNDLRADGSYNYSPAFTVEISVAGQGGTGEWGGPWRARGRSGAIS